MTDKMKGLLNSAKKLATLTNFLIITIVCILVYFIYKLVKKCNFNDSIQEGFVAQKELTDLLDKLRIKLYEKESVWSNELFNQQPERKEKTASFWEPKNETGQPFKRVGQCISVEENYDMPSNNTMLIDGDVKPPTDAKLLFQFSGNIISRNEIDSKNYNVYTGIRSLEEIDTRINELKTIQQQLIDHKITQENHLNNLITDTKDEFFIKLYKKDEFFNNTPVITVKNNTTINIPSGKYSSISIPFGSKVVLNSENGSQPLVIDLPVSLILDANNQPKPLTDELYNEIMTKIGLNGDDFNIFGKYGFGSVQKFGYGKTNNKDKSTLTMNYSQTIEDVYAPTNHEEKLGTGASQFFSLGITAIPTPLDYSYNYTVSNNAEHGYYGRTDLYNFAKKLSEQSNKINSLPIYRKDDNYITLANKPVYNLKNRNKIIPFNKKEGFVDFSKASCQASENSTGIISTQEKNTSLTIDDNFISHPYLTENQNKQLIINIDELSQFKNNIEELNNKFFWCNIPIDNLNIGEVCQNNQNKMLTMDLKGKGMYYLNLAFMYTTMKKMLKRTGEFATDVDSYGGSCCEVAELTEESLSRRPNFQGYVTSGTLSLNINDTQNPLSNYLNINKGKMINPMTKSLNSISQMINQLENLKFDLLENRFQHFPLKIYRPIPTKNYVSLGDVLFNHRNTNYNLRQPILDNIATIPKQCYKEVRDWLSVDKVYEYRDGDTYLAIFKNPYLQTFKAVTVPDTLPPGKVGKVVACVEGCRLLDDIIEADKCSKKFFKANKEIIEGTNLDPDNTIISRESTLYKNKIQDKQDRINTLKEVARRLQIQDDKANIINRQYNKQQLQNLVDNQRRNINTLVDELQDGKNRIDINVKFSYDKFQGLITILRENNSLPTTVADRITEIVDNSARQKLDALPNEDVKEVLASCPTPETEGLVVKALVESGCFNCYNLR